MNNLLNSLPVIYIKPGEFFLSLKPEIVVTVLGSCLSIVMYEPVSKLCGTCHAVFPTSLNYIYNDGFNPFNFVDSSIIKMINIFGEYGISKNKIQVKLFGGAEQMTGSRLNNSVGSQNIKKAVEVFKKEKIKPAAVDVGGNYGRKIYIISDTGEVFLTRLGITKINNCVPV